jgi:hypothetical protein
VTPPATDRERFEVALSALQALSDHLCADALATRMDLGPASLCRTSMNAVAASMRVLDKALDTYEKQPHE